METLFVLSLIGTLGWGLYRFHQRKGEAQRRASPQAEAAEQQRLADCQEVVRYFANAHGYLARTAVSRDELAAQIDAGVTAAELSDFIASRMAAVPGIRLGSQAGQWPVVLPESMRERHLYAVGKSGYGKTNFLRFLILQDIVAGKGVGVLAPEAELLTEEILPFIPEERIQDVIYFNPADCTCPVVLNPLHLEAGEDLDLHVDETVTIFQRIVGDGGLILTRPWGPCGAPHREKSGMLIAVRRCRGGAHPLPSVYTGNCRMVAGCRPPYSSGH